MNKHHNLGLFVVCAMVVACVGLLRGPDNHQSLTLVLQLATGIAGGIIGNALSNKSGPST